jgi:hypothetical protein
MICEDYESIVLLNQIPDEIKLHEHVPDITFGELLQSYRDSNNLKFSYDLLQNKVIIGLAEDAFHEDVEDITDIAEPDHSIELSFNKWKHSLCLFNELGYHFFERNQGKKPWYKQ